MSTRATYQFKADKNHSQPAVTIYIHYDGYLEGAACYFYNLLCNPSKGGAATQFIRANELAEITKGHDHHGDTEYRYDIEGSGPEAEVIAKKANWDSDFKNAPKWQVVAQCKLHEFVARYGKMIEDYQPFKELATRYGRKWLLNKVTAEKEINAQHGPLNHLRAWKGKSEDGANWKVQIDELRILAEAFPELVTNEIAEFLGAAPVEA